MFTALVAIARRDSIGADDAQAETAERATRAGDDGEKSPDMKVILGSVVDEGGMPVAGAKLWLPLRHRPRRIVEGTTDAAGHFELKFPAEWISPRWSGSSWTIWAYAPGHGMATVSPYEVVRGNRAEEVAIKLSPKANTRFKVLTPAGEPLAGALVRPQHYKTAVAYDLVPEEMLPQVSASTDASGEATLPAVQADPLSRVEIVSEKYGKQAIRVDRDKELAVRDIRLLETARIEGRLSGERPEWLRGVRVGFTVATDDEWSEPQGQAEAVTDDDGHFVVPTIACGGPLRSYVFLDPSLPVRPRLKDKLFLEAGETLRLEMPLVAAPKVRGKVQAKKSGRPVPNAEISLGYGGYHQSDMVVTDNEGRFEGRALPGPVRLQVIVLPEGFVQLGEPWAEPYQVPAGVEEFELPTIEVAASHPLSGKLIDEKGLPLAGVGVVAIHKNRIYGQATTDSAGRFVVHLPEGVETTIQVDYQQRGREPVEVVEKDPLVVRYSGGASSQFEAERQAKPDVILTGRVLLGGKPLEALKLTLSRGVPTANPRGPGRKPPQGMSLRIEKVVTAETDAEGRYRLKGLKAGDSYQVELKPPFAAADPAWRHQLPWFPKLPENAQGEVELPDVNLSKLTQSLAGKVVDPDGKPVEGAQVSAVLRDGFTSVARTSGSGPPPWTETDQQGRFKLRQLPEQPLALMAYIQKKSGGPIRFPAKVNVELNQQDIRIVLDPSLAEEEEE